MLLYSIGCGRSGQKGKDDMISLVIISIAMITGIPIMASIVLLTSGRPRRNTLFFLLAWLVTVFAVGLAFLLVGHASHHIKHEVGAVQAIRVILGVLLILLGVFQITKRKSEEEPDSLKNLDNLTIGGAMFLGFAVIGFNAEDLVLLSSASVEMMHHEYRILHFFLFSIWTTFLMSIPLIAYVCFPETANNVLLSVRKWLARHSWIVILVILVVIGSYMVYRGLR